MFIDRYGPWALIAGASEGTGAAFARRIAAEGIRPILVARRIEPLNDLATEIEREHGVESLTIATDLTAEDACDIIVQAVGGQCGRRPQRPGIPRC